MWVFSKQQKSLHFSFKAVILEALWLGFLKQPPISGACLTDWLSRVSVVSKPISFYLVFTHFKVCLVSSNTLQVILPECRRKVRQSGVLKTSHTRICPISSMLMGSISSAGIGSQQHLPGEHFQANILSTITKYDSVNAIIIYSLPGITGLSTWSFTEPLRELSLNWESPCCKDCILQTLTCSSQPCRYKTWSYCHSMHSWLGWQFYVFQGSGRWLMPISSEQLSPNW